MASPLHAAEQNQPIQPLDGGAGLVLPRGTDDDERSVGADLRYPEGPTGSYRPRHVRQTGKNCAFASASMLLDKWTGGKARPSQSRMRTASRVPASEGVSFGELSRAVGRVSGFDLRYSPGGGDPMTWNQLLSRLTRGGGAVVGGAYSRLPSHYQRWARDFARLGASGSGHAVYIERYEPGRSGGRVWLMDPLASSSTYRGEWISARALRQFSWRNSKGLVSAAATPEPPVLAGYAFGPPAIDEWLVAGAELKVRLPVAMDRGWPKPPDLRLAATWQLVEAEAERGSYLPSGPAASTGVTLQVSESEVDLAPNVDGLPSLRGEEVAVDIVSDANAPDETAHTSARLTLRDGYLVGAIGAPAQAGVHELHLELRHADGRSFGKGQAPDLESLTLRVRGELAAEWSVLPILDATVQDTLSRIQVQVVNRGSLDWLEHEAVTIVASWDTSVGSLRGGSARIELDSGEQGMFTVNTRVPSGVSEGTLRLELIDAGGVPLSEFGAEPQLVWLRFSSLTGDAPHLPEPIN
ncbi:hypothetical protein BH23CHL6_BH23CHL6_00020 [soil metagenome]